MGKQTPEVEELVAMIERLIPFLNAGTAHEREGEVAAWRDAHALVDRYRPTTDEITFSTSSSGANASRKTTNGPQPPKG